MRSLWAPLLWLLLGASPASPTAPGDDAFRRGDYPVALQKWGQALEEARAEKDPGLQFDLITRMAAVHRRIGKVNTAEAALEAAERLAESPKQKAQLALDAANNDLAKGDLPAAEKGFASAFKQLQGVRDPIGAATAAVNLGMARRLRGDAEGTTKALDAAETLYQALEDKGGQAVVALQQCRAFQSSGVLGKAAESCEKAGRLALKASEGGTWIESQVVRGEIFGALGRAGPAEAIFKGALERAKGRRDVMAQARLHNAIAGLKLRRGDPTARPHLELAEKAFSDAGAPKRALAVAVNLAVLDGGRAALEPLVERAADLDDRVLETTLLLNLAQLGDASALTRAGKQVDKLGHPDLLWRHRFLAGKTRLSSNPKDPKGVALLREAVDELERQRLSLDEDSKRSQAAFLTEYTDVYRALIDAYTSTGDDKNAFVWAQRLGESEAPMKTDPTLQVYGAKEAWLAEKLEEAQDPEVRQELARQIGQLRVEFARKVDEMRSSVKDFDRMVRMDPEDLEAVMDLLPEGVTVLQPVLFSDQVVLMVLRRDFLKVVQVPLDGKALQDVIKKLARSLQGKYLTDPAWTDLQAERLGNKLFAPIEKELAGTEVLVISANGPLREVPFAMLRWNDAYAGERFGIAGITSVSSISRVRKPFQLDPARTLLVGNPDGTLPGAEAEVQELHDLLRGSQALIGPQGTREAIFDKMTGRTAIHLATHGRILEKNPPDSYLALAGNGDEGRLTYREIPGLAGLLSDTRLVVLSACKSGTSITKDDGIVVTINGLAAQFRRAGVETLVASLWSVDDAGTRALMTAMYEELSTGADVAQALRAAQDRMRAHPKFSHPWYWAGFVVVGDWR